MRTLGKRVMQQCIRGFESLSVRHFLAWPYGEASRGGVYRVYPKVWGRGIFLGLRDCLAALSDDSEAVVVAVFEAISSTLNELHFAMEAFGNSIVTSEAPHAGNGFEPVGESPS